MLKLSKTQMKRYEYGDYDVYIDDVGSYWEAWLCRKGYGVIDYLFSLPKVDNFFDGTSKERTEEMFLERVEANLPGCIEEYNEDHPRDDY